MLVPAASYRYEIEKEFQKNYYTDDMIYVTGCLENWLPNVADCSDGDRFQYAIVNKDNKAIGYLDYQVDYYVSKVYNIAILSFDRGNGLVGKDIFDKFEELIDRFHRIEWRAVSCNPACRGYDNFIKKHNGNKYILKDSIKDRDGNYHDDIIYEIITDNK